eukprot:6997955-Pyramimonas_sp.AAC.1
MQEAQVYSHGGPIGCRTRRYILTTDQSDAGSAGIFSWWTNQTRRLHSRSHPTGQSGGLSAARHRRAQRGGHARHRPRQLHHLVEGCCGGVTGVLRDKLAKSIITIGFPMVELA